MANYKEKEWEWEGEKYLVQPGQFITSLKSIAHKAGNGISIRNIRTALEKFEKYEFLTSKSTNKNRLITIVNWELYQSEEDELTNKLTSDRQADDKQPTTNKKDNNINNTSSLQKTESETQLVIEDVPPAKPKVKKSEIKSVFSTDDKEYKLACYLSKQIAKRLDKPLQEEKTLQKWSIEFERMVRRDGYDINEIKDVLVFSQKDPFWQDNIMSASKFRKQYLTLLGKMKKDDEL